MTAGVDHHERPGRPRLKFSLRGLMVVVFGAAVAMAVMRQQGNEWFDGLLAAVTCWFALGLLQQVRDLWRTCSGRADLPRDERWGCRLAIGWRLAAILVMAAYYVFPPMRLMCFDRSDYVGFARYFDTYRAVLLHEALFLLVILVVVWSVVGSGARRDNRPWWQRLVTGAAWCLAAIACLILWRFQSTLHFLYYLSLWGIAGVAPDLPGRAEPFVLRSALAAGCVLVNVALLSQVARRWHQGTRQRLILLGILVVPLAVTVAHAVWLHTFGAYGLSAELHEGLTSIWRWPAEAWPALALLAVTAASLVACRLIWRGEVRSLPAEASHRRRQPRYYHESRACRLLLIAGMLGALHGSAAWHLQLEEIAEDLFEDPLNYLRAALVLLAFKGFGWSGARADQHVAVPRIDPLQFALLWPLVLLVVVSGAVTFAWLGFAIWLVPFCRWFSG